jgi:Ethanolamine utilization protein EutJ (predicted chaperonin)
VERLIDHTVLPIGELTDGVSVVENIGAVMVASTPAKGETHLILLTHDGKPALRFTIASQQAQQVGRLLLSAGTLPPAIQAGPLVVGRRH